MEILSISADTAPFQFNVAEALKTGFYISGTTGCGKTTLAKLCVNDLRAAGVTVYIFDPSQAWVNKYPIRRIVTFGEVFSPISLEAGLKSIITELQDCIFDMSTLPTMQFQEVADKFCWLLFNSQVKTPEEQRRQMFVIFEEAHIVLPEGSMKAKRLQNIVRLATVGRNFKIRVGEITQFASMLDKSILRFAGQRYFGWADEYNDTKRISSMVGKNAAESLKYYKTGEFFYYCPSLGKMEKIVLEPPK